MATSTLTQMQTWVQAVLGLDSTDSSMTALILRKLNEGYEDVLRRTHCDIETATLSLTSGTYDYTLPTQALLILDAQNSAAGSSYNMEHVTFAEIMDLRRTTGGSPARKFAVEGDTLSVWPTPGTGESMSIYYVPRPTALASGSDTPSSIPAEFQNILETYALAKLSEIVERGTPEGSQKWIAEYESQIRELRRHTQLRGSRRPPRMTVGRSTSLTNDRSVVQY